MARGFGVLGSVFIALWDFEVLKSYSLLFLRRVLIQVLYAEPAVQAASWSVPPSWPRKVRDTVFKNTRHRVSASSLETIPSFL